MQKQELLAFAYTLMSIYIYVVVHQSYVAGEVAVATVAEFLVAAGAFRTNAMEAGDGEVEKDCAEVFDCLRVRRAPLVVCDRSMLWLFWRRRKDERRGKQ